MRLYFYNESGRALFYLQVEHVELLDEYQLTYSLCLKLELLPDYQETCKSVLSKNIDWRERTALLNGLGNKITDDSAFEKYFFPDFMLDSYGRFNESYTAVLEHSIDWPDLPDYSLYSDSCNPVLFQAGKYHFYSDVLPDPLYASKEHFLELIAEHTQLQNQYVEHLGPNNEFYVSSLLNSEGVPYDIYYMVDANELKFFFTRKTPMPD